MIKKVLVPGIVVVGVVFTAWQVYGKVRYDDMRGRLETPAFTVRPIDAETAEFIGKVKETWSLHQQENPDPIFAEISSVTGFEENVEGVAKLYTHEIPEYSFVDLRRNAKEAVMAVTLAVAIPQSLDNQFYTSEGIGFVKLGENHLELFEDTDEGLSRSLYINQEAQRQNLQGGEIEAPAGEGGESE